MFTPLSTLETIWRNNNLKSRSLPGLQWETDNLYQTSALLAAFFDTATLSYRLRQTPESLPRFCECVTPAGRKMTAAGLALPFGLREGQDLIEFLDQSGDHALLTQLTPGCEPGTSYVVQSVTARGIPVERLKRPRELAGDQLRMAAYGCDSISHMLQLYYQCTYHGSVTNAAATPLPLKTQLPFPYEMFAAGISRDGYRLPEGRNARRVVVWIRHPCWPPYRTPPSWASIWTMCTPNRIECSWPSCKRTLILDWSGMSTIRRWISCLSSATFTQTRSIYRMLWFWKLRFCDKPRIMYTKNTRIQSNSR